MRALRTSARILLGVLMSGAGILHLTLARTDFRAQVPDWLPLDEDLTVLGSGVVEIALGLALLLARRRRRTAGLALAAFYLAILPGNVGQYLEDVSAFGLDTDAARLARLPFQALLVLWALWAGEVLDPDPDAVDAAREGARVRRARVATAIVVVLVLLVTPAAALWHRHTHPDLLRSDPLSLRAIRPVGAPLYLPLTLPDPGGDPAAIATVRGGDLSALDLGTTRARAGLWLCRLVDGPVEGPISERVARSACATLVPIDGTTGIVPNATPPAQVMLRLAPQAAGRIRLGQVRVSYDDGSRSGTVPLGPTGTIVVR